MLNLGKREAGLLTAASPGDTLVFPFTVVDGTGASVALDTGFGVDNIEVFKNGQPTARATDSGYSLISDTGMTGNRPGLYRISVQLYNTADDATFYAAGNSYQVAIDSVEVGTLLRRQWLGVFEIGRQKVNAVEIDSDTGPADNLGRIAGDTGTGSYLWRHRDTGGIADAIWAKDIRTLTAYPFLDTGVAETVWRYTDTDARMVNVKAIQNDTGAAAHLQQAMLNTGRIAADIRAVLADTGAAHLDQGRFGVISDSGRMAAVLDTGKAASAVWTSHQTRTLTAFALDTGIAQTVWREQNSTYTDTGSLGFGVNVHKLSGDTGATERLKLLADLLSATGQIPAAAIATGAITAAKFAAGAIDAAAIATGAIDADALAADAGTEIGTAVWASTTRTLTSYPFLDTGVAETVWRYTDTDARRVNVRAIMDDTGAAGHLAQAFAEQNTNSDTGLIQNAATIRAKTDSLTFTVAGQVDSNIQYVNDVQIQGAGDTGTGNTWRPV